MKKVAVQKGEVIAHQPTMKSMSRKEVNAQDLRRQDIKESGMKLTKMTPKQ